VLARLGVPRSIGVDLEEPQRRATHLGHSSDVARIRALERRLDRNERSEPRDGFEHRRDRVKIDTRPTRTTFAARRQRSLDEVVVAVRCDLANGVDADGGKAIEPLAVVDAQEESESTSGVEHVVVACERFAPEVDAHQRT